MSSDFTLMGSRRWSAVVVLVTGLSVAGCGPEEPDAPPDDPAVVSGDLASPSEEPAPVSDTPAAASAGEAAPDEPWVYVCDDGFRFAAYLRDDSVRVDLGLRELVLARELSASGVRYAGSGASAWFMGDEASVDIDGSRRIGCDGRRVPETLERAAMLGADFRGLGQEPGWIVDIDEDRGMEFLGDYGEVRVVTPTPTRRTGDDGTLVYEGTTDGATLRVKVVHEPCTDPMSGRAFPRTVTVEFGERTWNGCGRPLG